MRRSSLIIFSALLRSCFSETIHGLPIPAGKSQSLGSLYTRLSSAATALLRHRLPGYQTRLFGNEPGKHPFTHFHLIGWFIEREEAQPACRPFLSIYLSCASVFLHHRFYNSGIPVPCLYPINTMNIRTPVFIRAGLFRISSHFS